MNRYNCSAWIYGSDFDAGKRPDWHGVVTASAPDIAEDIADKRAQRALGEGTCSVIDAQIIR